ncbi:hypothetical protein PO909_006405 [Leuciscus waleckii]
MTSQSTFKFILIITLLQLCLSDVPSFKTNQPEFGDILEFPTRGPCRIKVASHYAIFVGDEKIPGKKEEDNIFDMLKYEDGTSGCAFRHLDIKENVTVNNYQDDKVRPAKADVIAALIKMNKGCGEWSLANTCEHIATSIRYGEANAKCKQKGSLAAAICPFINFFSEVKKSLNASRSGHAAAEAA